MEYTAESGFSVDVFNNHSFVIFKKIYGLWRIPTKLHVKQVNTDETSTYIIEANPLKQQYIPLFWTLVPPQEEITRLKHKSGDALLNLLWPSLGTPGTTTPLSARTCINPGIFLNTDESSPQHAIFIYRQYTTDPTNSTIYAITYNFLTETLEHSVNGKGICCTSAEDARLFSYKNTIYLSFNRTCKLNGKIAYTKMFVKPFDDCNEVYLDVNSTPSWEKNWIFYENNQALHMIYTVMPLVIYKVDLEKATTLMVVNMPLSLKDKGVLLRGGTNVVSFGEYFYMFLHSSLSYDIYAMKFNSNYTSIYVTENPIVRKVVGAKIYFPTGAALYKSDFHIFMGVDDIKIQKFIVSKEYVDSCFM